MELDPYLMFNGNCAEAFQTYAKIFNGQVTMMMTFGESPEVDKIEPHWRDKIMHAHLVFGPNVLMASDAPPQYREDMQGVSLSLKVDSAAEAERLYDALSDGGSVQMPLGETFWAHRFAMLTDRFGIRWMINCERAA